MKKRFLSILENFDSFFNQFHSVKKIALFRITLGCIYLLNQLLLVGHLESFFANTGYFTGSFIASRTNGIVAGWLSPGDESLFFYFDKPYFVYSVYWLHILALILFIIGYRTRIMAGIIWVVALSIHKRYPFIAVGEDTLPRVFFFFFMFFDASQAYVPSFIRKKITRKNYAPIRWPLRVIQLQVGIGYAFAAIFKATHSKQWLNGTHNYAMLNFPLKSYFNATFLYTYPSIIAVITYWILFWELSFVYLVWYPKLRKFAITNMILLHLGILISLNAFTFSPLMITTLPIFFSNGEHRNIRLIFLKLWGTRVIKAFVALLIIFSIATIFTTNFTSQKPLYDFSREASDVSCPDGFIPVPPDHDLGINSPFCVMKYEARQSTEKSCNGTFCPISVSHSLPWTNISRYDAEKRCQDIGAKLITDREWIAIAKNILRTPINDISLYPDIQLATGHSNNDPSGSISGPSEGEPVIRGCNLGLPLFSDTNKFVKNSCEFRGDNLHYANGFFGTNSKWDDTGMYFPGKKGISQLRTHILSNGEIIWDLAGNVWEWTNLVVHESKTGMGEKHTNDSDGITGYEMPRPLNYHSWTRDGWTDFALIEDFRNLQFFSPPFPMLQTRKNGFGGIFINPGFSWGNNPDGSLTTNSTVHNSMRGGSWIDQGNAGIFAVALTNDPSHISTDIGFRCTR